MGTPNGHPPTPVSTLNTAVPTPASRGSPSTPAAGTPDPPGTPVTPGTPGTLGTPGTPQTPSKRYERKERKKGAGLTEGDAEMEAIPENNLLIVMPCICLVLFLAALDQTIVATALPVIAEKFNATPSQYSWIVTSYQLAMTLLTPVNGRVSDIVGRKPMLYVAIIVFTIFSALCGAAQSAEMLIVCRALQGLGGGTIIGLTSIVVSDIVPLSKRGAYQGFFGATWGIASALGPILGGLLADAPHGGWRWCFFINLPTAGLAFLGLVLKLNLNKPKGHTFQQFMRTFDFVGLLLVMIGGSLLIVGFSFAADHGFKDTAAIAVIVVGAVFMIAAIINCLFTKRNAVIPARMFKIRTTLFYTIASTLHAAAFIPCNILLPQFFMGVNGSSPISAGVQLLPFAIFVSLGTVVAGQVQSFLRIVRPITWVGYAMAILGFALLHKYFVYELPRSRQYGLLIIPAMGIGLSLQSPLIIMQAAMPLKEMASVTSAWVLTRSLGGSVGVSIMTAVLNSDLRSEFVAAGKKHGGLDGAEVPTNAAGYTALHHMPDSPLKWDLLNGFADAFKPVWIVCIAFLAACLVITIPTRSYSLNRIQGGPKAAGAEEDVEAQAGSADYDTEEKLEDADDDTKVSHSAATASNASSAHRPSADSFQTAAALPTASSEKRPL